MVLCVGTFLADFSWLDPPIEQAHRAWLPGLVFFIANFVVVDRNWPVVGRHTIRLAIQQVRRMRGGSQSHLMRCDDDAYYVVKFQNNPQHVRILANEMLGTRLAARLGLCVPQVEVIEVRPELIMYTTELVMELGLGRIPCSAGKQLGSRFPVHPARMMVYDFLPDELLGRVLNCNDFLGIFVFDKWTCNTDGRQAIFFFDSEMDPLDHPWYRAMMIDQGFCFNGGEWNFPDAPLRGLYSRKSVYQGVIGMVSFEPWLDRLEKSVTETMLLREARRIPREWYSGDWQALHDLMERLYVRRNRVRELIYSALRSDRNPFPNWEVRAHAVGEA
jgi:hypothetical protein